MKRYEFLEVLADHVTDELAVIALGGTIGEWDHLRPSPKNLFLKIMGSITAVAFGIARALPNRKVISLDTDGSLLLNMGILPTLGNEQPKNLVVFVLDNECYEVIGSPPTHTKSGRVDMAGIAKGAGVEKAVTVRTLEEAKVAIKEALSTDGPTVVVAKLERGTKVFPEEERKRTDGIEDKYRFVRHIEDLEGITIIPREVKSLRKVEGKIAWD